MTSPIKRFAWKDRETAAHDILQIVYHAPPYLSRHTIQLLQAFRSPEVLPDIQAIFLDETQEVANRIFALHAYALTPGDVISPELATMTAAIIADPKGSNLGWDLHDFMVGVLHIVDKHPSNHGWFFSILDDVEDASFLLSQLRNWSSLSHSDEFQRLLDAQKLSVLDDNPALLDLRMVSHLTLRMERNKVWLHAHMDEIVNLFMTVPKRITWKQVVRRWSELADILREKIDDLDALIARSEKWHARQQRKKERQAKPPAYPQSAAYQYLHEIYTDARGGDERALKNLKKLATTATVGSSLDRVTINESGEVSLKPSHSVPFRAVAAHFIGKLYKEHNVTDTLYKMMKYDTDSWGMVSPIRYEAGEALLNMPTVETWETLVDTYFVKPSTYLIPYQLDWIAHITDVLSGESNKVYNGLHRNFNKRQWLNAMSDISDEELESLTRRIRR